MAAQCGISLGDMLKTQEPKKRVLTTKSPERCLIIGGEFDGKCSPPPPTCLTLDDGKPHCAFHILPDAQQNQLPLYVMLAFYRWDGVKRQWYHVSTEPIRKGPDIEARMHEINEKGRFA